MDDAGRTPLHWAATESPALGAVAAKIRYLANRAPDLVGVADKEGRLPLHSVVHHESMLTYLDKASDVLEAVQILLYKKPEALRNQDSQGNLPLHVAARRYAPIPVLRLLVERYPEALHVRNLEDGCCRSIWPFTGCGPRL